MTETENAVIKAVALELNLTQFRQLKQRYPDAVRIFMTPRRRWIVEILSSWAGRVAALAVGDLEAENWDALRALEAELQRAHVGDAKWSTVGASDPAAPSDFTNWRYYIGAGQAEQAGPTPWTEIK